MPSCRNCGAYTKYSGGLCKSCYYSNKPKPGKVYLLERESRSGKKTVYTGITRRPVYTRVGEHMGAQNSGNTRTYMGRGIRTRLLGAFNSKNPEKAERTIKNELSSDGKRELARYGARKFKRRSFW